MIWPRTWPCRRRGRPGCRNWSRRRSSRLTGRRYCGCRRPPPSGRPGRPGAAATAIFAGPMTWFATRTLPTPAAAIAAASQIVATVTPIAPACTCISAMSGHFCTLVCGRRFAVWPSSAAIIVAMFRSSLDIDDERGGLQVLQRRAPVLAVLFLGSLPARPARAAASQASSRSSRAVAYGVMVTVTAPSLTGSSIREARKPDRSLAAGRGVLVERAGPEPRSGRVPRPGLWSTAPVRLARSTVGPPSRSTASPRGQGRIEPGKGQDRSPAQLAASASTTASG